MNYYRLLLPALLCSQLSFSQEKIAGLIDSIASPATKKLYKLLHRLDDNYVLFGQQHATEYGHGWQGDEDRSDVKSVTGSHPAVIGVDFMGLSGRPEQEIQYNIDQLKKNMIATYERGGITTIAWHFSNPVSPGGFYWDKEKSSRSVKELIPGGTHHSEYKTILERIGSMLNNLKAEDGHLVPLIFRPYHEMDGDWFWWGKPYCTAEEFKTLWRFTVSYLRDSLDVHNLIYAFSPDRFFTTREEYLERYPGDEWVDVVGVDNYADFGRDGKYDLAAGIKKLQIVSAYAMEKRKLAAFTETGLESVADSNWFTASLLKALKSEGVRLCYVLVWRNDRDSPTHYYAPFPGHPAVPNFLRFFRDPMILFEEGLRRQK